MSPLRNCSKLIGAVSEEFMPTLAAVAAAEGAIVDGMAKLSGSDAEWLGVRGGEAVLRLVPSMKASREIMERDT